MRISFSILLLAASLSSTSAMAWEEMTDFRGLEIYDYAATGISIKIVCDPNGAFIPPMQSARFETSHGDIEGDVVLRTGENSYTFVATHSSVLPTDSDSWSTMIRGLQSGSRFELIADDQVYQVDTEAPFPAACGADGL